MAPFQNELPICRQCIMHGFRKCMFINKFVVIQFTFSYVRFYLVKKVEVGNFTFHPQFAWQQSAKYMFGDVRRAPAVTSYQNRVVRESLRIPV